MPLLHPSIADILERDFIERLLRDPSRIDSLFNIKGIDIKGAAVLRERTLRGFREHPGEVDILIVPEGRPDEATAIQVKRFDVVLEADEEDECRIARLEKLFNKGIKQANEMARLGFWQVYLWMFVCIDSRVNNRGRYTFDGPGSAISSIINQTIALRSSPTPRHKRVLNPRVGLIQHEWVQSMDNPPLGTGTYAGHLKRLATMAQQPPDLTEWVISQLTSNDLHSK